MAFSVLQFGAGMDNTFHLVGDADLKRGIVIDPFDADSALAAVAKSGWTLSAIVNTHGHWDHVGGNEALHERFGVPIFAHPLEEVPNAQAIGTTVMAGTSTLQVLRTPGHRPGHVCLLGEGALFTGDTVFAAGCGNPKFGGNVEDLFESFQLLGSLPGEQWMYPGHDYAEKNLSFSAAWEPENTAIAEGRAYFQALDRDKQPHRSRLADEKRWNLFFRLTSMPMRERLRAAGHIQAGASDKDVFLKLRELRNAF